MRRERGLRAEQMLDDTLANEAPRSGFPPR
jgi:hypothetical protein